MCFWNCHQFIHISIKNKDQLWFVIYLGRSLKQIVLPSVYKLRGNSHYEVVWEFKKYIFHAWVSDKSCQHHSFSEISNNFLKSQIITTLHSYSETGNFPERWWELMSMSYERRNHDLPLIIMAILFVTGASSNYLKKNSIFVHVTVIKNNN